MARDSDASMGSGSYQSVNLGGRDFWLMPKGDGGSGTMPQAQPKHTELLRFDHPELRKYLEYVYTPLPRDKKMIRLVKLYSGEVDGRQIYCELIEVEYNSEFHIPINVQKTEAPKGGKSRKTRDSGTDPSSESDEDGDRSDVETRWKEKKEETREEELLREKRQERRDVLRLVEDLKRDPEEEQRKEKEKIEKRFAEWKAAKENEAQYEALSWCWGDAEEDYAILIKRGETTYRKRVKKELALALKHLRKPGQGRTIWIDAVCIDQGNPEERNHQVQMMSRIYTRAQQVCVWLGEADTDSEIAINFIKYEIKELKNFDTISSDEQYSRKWQALMSLMQREWFFRRWVVQEIALARAATVYCGSHSVPWKSFAVAVELFVEVETATHRLSEVMKRDEKFRHVPGWFEYVSELGASLLVQATGKVFRTKRTPMQQDTDSSDDGIEEGSGHDKKRDDQRVKRSRKKDEENEMRYRIREAQTIDPLERRSLLSLEYLVSTMFIFQASEPRDVVYALLAIAKDASPFAPAQYSQDDQKLFLVMTLLDRFLAEKPFVVDYNRPYSDVSRDFVEFSIARTYKTDPAQALDILCRPWALDPPREKSVRLKKHKVGNGGEGSKKRRLMAKRTRWKVREIQEEKKDTGTWEEGGRQFRHRYIKNDNPVWKPDSRDNHRYRREIEAKKEWNCPCTKSGCTHIEGTGCAGFKWKPSEGWEEIKEKYFPPKEDSNQLEPDIGLPSWVARASQAPFMLDHSPGMDMRKTSRANADPLVGSPHDGHRNYNAAGSESLDPNSLKFKKRPVLGHYSLYVKGFELDEVEHVEDASQSGGIPRAWLELGGWEDLKKDPPDEFWRTIVADRGRDNRNPPYYYARACKESVHKGGHLGGSVNTTALIHDERNSIVAEFCRRVHAVIWNRCLFRTKGNRLGLAHKVKPGDKVCILYGCTVPVILSQNVKETAKFNEKTEPTREADLTLEREEDRVEALKACIRRANDNRNRKAKYMPTKKKYMENGTWEEMMDARQAYLKERSREKEAAHKTADERAREDRFKKDRTASRLRLAKTIKTMDESCAKAEATKIHAKGMATTADKEKTAAEVEVRDAKHHLETAIAATRQSAVRRAAAKQAAGERTSGHAENGSASTMEATEDGAADIAAAKKLVEKAESKKRTAEDAIRKANQSITGANNTIKESKKKRGGALKAVEDYLEEFATTAGANEEMAAEGSHGGDSGTGGSSTTAGESAASEAETEDTKASDDRKPWEHLWYEFKGECYLHGMMDGEAMREKFYKDLENWIFELR